MRRLSFAMVLMVVLIAHCESSCAIHLGADDRPYSLPMEHPLDAPLNEMYGGKCFFMNLGPTGIRARIDPDAPKQFRVMYVFQDDQSPARGQIEIGDMIVGANGKKFKNPHGFHRKHGGRGWPGPPYELSLAIEDSQGKDGKLKLMVLPGGDERARKEVTLQLKPVGRFAETYPWNCPRSEELLKQLCDFMIDKGIQGRHHYQIQQLLALWAADDKRVMPLVEAKAAALMKSPPQYTATGMCTWGWGYTGIFLGEYYHETKDKGVKAVAEALAESFEKGQDWRTGGFSHRPFPAIERRIAAGGPKGYGSMAGPGGLAMLAQSIFKQVGLPYSERAYQRTHLAYLQTAGGNSRASIAYGFAGWPQALIRLRTPASPCKSEEGIGYRCPTGMDGVGDFEAEKWTQGAGGKWDMSLVAPKGEFSWLTEAIGDLSVFETAHYVDDGSRQRMVVRPPELKEPTSAYNTAPGGGGHVAPMGMGAVAHFIGNKGNKSWGYLGKHLAAGCALSPQMMFDGHADATMHSFFSVLGAARADEKDLRAYLDYAKTWIILSESHDGQGLIDQPFGCQRNSTCSISRDRTAYTHTAILLLSIPKHKLLITGADTDMAQPASSTGAGSHFGSSRFRSVPEEPEPELRKARRLSPDKQSVLDRALRNALVQLSEGGLLKAQPVRISKSKSQIRLTKAEADGTLTFREFTGNREARFNLADLSRGDHAVLALLITRLSPASSDTLAMAAVYLESLGRVEAADGYFDKADESSRRKLEQLFE